MHKYAQKCMTVHTMNIKAKQKQKKQCYIAYEDHDAAMTAQVPLLVVDECILDMKPDKLDLTTFSTPFFVSLGHSHHSHFSLGSTSFETVHINLTRLENKKSSTLERPHLGQDFDQPRCTTSICSRKDNGKIACSLKIGSKLGTSWCLNLKKKNYSIHKKSYILNLVKQFPWFISYYRLISLPFIS